MKIIILILIIIILLFLLALVYSKYTHQSRQLVTLKNAIAEADCNNSYNNILLPSQDMAIRQLLVEINHVLEHKFDMEIKVKAQEESNKKMLANISHDLKTPLTVILGYTELLQNASDINKEIKEKLNKIEKKAQDVLELINMFFDLMRLESGDFPLNIEIIDINELCREEIINYYDVLQSEGFKVDLEIPDQQILIQADTTALKRVLANLIQNVIRYGAEGKYLKLKLWEQGNGCYIEVADKGKGIIEDKQDKIFERLFTLEDSRNKKYQGSGLGLTITKRLIESMNGTISLKSRPYIETVFTVCLKKPD
ncbi:MAG: HAMP domain-containing sensor histidine kinase [Anaerocolumna sp.]